MTVGIAVGASALADGPDPATKKRRRSTRIVLDTPRATRRAQTRLGLLLVAPVMILVLLFFLVPLGNAIYYAFVDFNGVNPNPEFVGLANFIELFQDPNLWPALKNNAIWIIIGTIAPLVIGLALALLMWNVGRGGVLYRVAFFLPYVLPQVAVGVVWSWIYDPVRGWLNQALDAVGLSFLRTGWLGNPDTALFAVLATAIWATSGFVFVILLAALRNVDIELVDASRLDGANTIQRLWYIILPQIMPVFLMVTTITLVGGFSVFDIIFVMTGGGPAGATDVLGTLAYSEAFQLNRISYGTTIALVMTVLAVPFAVWLNRLQRRVSLQGTGA
ncbi:carbohydrate ABC transporter permease [Microbacterium lushaniae]|uniref:Sugar ABC transporter permease n=1 Tax=Microbacterium lushaniae TaxID=2614639 RepID=A0A5J6L2E3_9MICO|nr:sugar ABC transporter permease [Microbacterium lushaniae]QEW02743.1 sugar ABC transporter permease [Microbacterium lushaniae]